VFFVTSITLAYISTSTGDSLQNLAKARAARKVEKEQGAIPPVDAKPEEPAAPATTPLPVNPVPGNDAPAAPPTPSAPAPSDSKPATP
jgi:hypothetical protein